MLSSDQTGAAATLNGIFESHPDEALALVRAWIAEGARYEPFCHEPLA